MKTSLQMMENISAQLIENASLLELIYHNTTGLNLLIE